MTQVQNVLFIMADQLRADHLGCYGHPYLRTASLDALARRGCGSSGPSSTRACADRRA